MLPVDHIYETLIELERLGHFNQSGSGPVILARFTPKTHPSFGHPPLSANNLLQSYFFFTNLAYNINWKRKTFDV